MAAALPMIRICVVRVGTTVKGTGYAEHSQFARYTAGANVAARAICSVCTALWSSSKNPAVSCLAALLARPIDLPLSTWPLLVSISKVAESKSTKTSWKTPSGLPLLKRELAVLGRCRCGQRSAILDTIFESCRCRSIDPYAYPRDVLARPSSMTNWQVKHIAPQPWAKASCSPATAPAA